jgi:hypothetical protein
MILSYVHFQKLGKTLADLFGTALEFIKDQLLKEPVVDLLPEVSTPSSNQSITIRTNNCATDSDYSGQSILDELSGSSRSSGSESGMDTLVTATPQVFHAVPKVAHDILHLFSGFQPIPGQVSETPELDALLAQGRT